MAFSARYTVSQQHVSLSAHRPVRAQRLQVPGPVGPHDHAYHEICVVLEGSVVHQTLDGETCIGPGRTIVVPPGAVHALRPLGQLGVVNAYYLAEWLAMDLAMLWAEPNLVPLFLSQSVMNPAAAAKVVEFDLSPDELSAVARDLDEIDGESRTTHTPNTLIRGAFLKVLARLSRASLRSLPHQQYFRPQVQTAISHIEQLVQAAAPLNVSMLAEEAKLSTDYLAKLFSAAMGRTISDYFQLRRVHRACQLLMDPRLSITEAAMQIGYSDAPHFCRMFKRYRGMSPTAYRSTYAPKES